MTTFCHPEKNSYIFILFSARCWYGICLLVIVIVGGVDSVEDPVSPGWATLPVKHIPRPDFVLKKGKGSRDVVRKTGGYAWTVKNIPTKIVGEIGVHAWTFKHIPRPYFVQKNRDRVTKFCGGNEGHAWTVKHIPHPYFLMKIRDRVMRFCGGKMGSHAWTI
jgi:hypothetical protein